MKVTLFKAFVWVPLFLTLAASSAQAENKNQPKPAAAGGSASITLERLEATINGALILKTDIQHFRKTLGLRQQLDPLFAGTSLAAKGPQASDQEIIDYLIDEQIILNLFPVADSEVEQEINTIQANNRMDRKTLRTAIGEQGFSFEDYFQLIRVGVAKRGLIDRDIRTKVSISDDDVKNHFYNTIARNSAVPRAFKVRILTISPSNYKSASAAQDVISRARKQIQGGESFEEVAKAVSDDPSAANGGDLGTLTEDQMSPAIRDALKKLKIGETSQVLGDAKSRYFILKLVDVTSAESDRFKQQKEEIRNQLAAGEYQRQIQLWLDRQRQSASIHRNGQKTAADTAVQ